MKALLEKWYITLKLMQIARQNEKRYRFYEKYDFDDYGEDLDNACLVRATVDSKGLKELNHDDYSTNNKLQKDDFGIEEYIKQTVGYCEDDFSGVTYRKTPIKGLYIRIYYQC